MKNFGAALKGRLAKTIKISMGNNLSTILSLGVPLARRALITVFHRVNDAAAPDGMTVSSDGFRDYCAYFKKHFSVISLDALVDKLERHEDVSRNMAITFDDGYRDNHDIAAPILEEFGLMATFFLTTDYIGNTSVPWWDKDSSVPHPFMQWSHVSALRSRGFGIGSHTRSHADLGKVSGEAAREELVGSRKSIEDHLGEAVKLFAFPYGFDKHMSQANLALVKEAGYRCCCSYGPAISPHTDPFRLGRICISDWFASPAHFGGHALVLAARS